MSLINKKATNFTLPDHTGKEHTLTDFLDSYVVLYFYPKDNTPGCTLEADNFREHYNEFQNKGVVIIGVSGDSVKSHKNFKEKLDLPFILLSDSDGNVLKKYEADKKGEKRKTYVIDPNGKIVLEYQNVSPKTHAKQILKDLEKISD